MARIYIDGNLYTEADIDNQLGHGNWVTLLWPKDDSDSVIIACDVRLESITTHRFKMYYSISGTSERLAQIVGRATAYIPEKIRLAEILLT